MRFVPIIGVTRDFRPKTSRPTTSARSLPQRARSGLPDVSGRSLILLVRTKTTVLWSRN